MQANTQAGARADALSQTFAALADPTRRAILQRLAAGEAVVKDLALPFEMSSPAVSKHLRVLERAGLIEQGRQAQWRPRRLRAQPLAAASDWLEAYRPFWEERFERMDELLHELKAKPAVKPRSKRTPKTTPKTTPKATRKPAR